MTNFFIFNFMLKIRLFINGSKKTKTKKAHTEHAKTDSI